MAQRKKNTKNTPARSERFRDWYTFTLADGRTYSGPVQGCGGTLRGEDGWRNLAVQILRANEGEKLGIYEPEPGCVSLNYYNPNGPNTRRTLSLVGAELVTASEIEWSIRDAMVRYALKPDEAEAYVLAPDWNAVSEALEAFRKAHGYPADSSGLTRGFLVDLVRAQHDALKPHWISWEGPDPDVDPPAGFEIDYSRTETTSDGYRAPLVPVAGKGT